MYQKSQIDHSFDHIAPSIHFRLAPKASSGSDSERTLNPQDPNLILLFSWTSARHLHISKYTTRYARMYPSSAIMVITISANDLLYRSSERKQRSLSLAIRTILSHNLDGQILIHCFSEGGIHKASEFAKAYLKTAGQRLPISAMYLDSTPGTLNPSEISNMWKSVAPRTLATKLITPAVECTYVASYHARSKHLFAEAHRALDDDSLWDIKVPRCYLYSDADHLVGSEGILEHSRRAASRGTPVSVIRFENSAHCAHVREDPDKYWDAVQHTWWIAQDHGTIVTSRDDKEILNHNVSITLCELTKELK